MQKIEPLANEFITVYRSDTRRGEYAYTPGICVLPGGRIIATLDRNKCATVSDDERGMVFLSDDGLDFRFVSYFPFVHARPFAAGNSVYIIGQKGNIRIIRSDDDGETWSRAVDLAAADVPETQCGNWHASATNVWHENGHVYLVMEHLAADDCVTWPVAALAPVLMRAKDSDDLTRPESWTFASRLYFRNEVDQDKLDFFGVPFYQVSRGSKIDAGRPKGVHVSPLAPVRTCAPIGWLETNVVRILDPGHYWYDPSGHTFHLFARAHTGGTGYAALCKVTENADGTMTTSFETVPSGRSVVFLPMPGGQMRFHMLYDEITKRYWLLSTQATDSMTRAELLPRDRYNLPNNERRRLALHFSKNCVDWCFAGLVAVGDSEIQSRHYASMAFRGDDLLILSRSGDENAKSAHDGNIITLHTVKNFRDLVY